MPLELLAQGERGEITEIRHYGSGGGCHCHNHGVGQGLGRGRGLGCKRVPGDEHTTRAEEMGLRVGKQVEVLKNEGRLLLLMVDETRIAIDRRMARGIMVKGVTI